LRTLSALLFFVAAATARAEKAPVLKLPAILGSNAVFQSGVPLPVWGWAKPGSAVRVSLAGQERAARAGRDGRWKVVFDALNPGPVGDLVVSSGTKKAVSTNLLAGEVWLCSGQSNMAFKVNGARNKDEEIKAADFPSIRLFLQEGLLSEKPLPDTSATWKVCSPLTVGDFSAVGYFFGREVRRKAGVPVGLIDASWGGTNIQCWMDEEALAGTKWGPEELGNWKAKLKADPGLAGASWNLEVKDLELVPADGGKAVPFSRVDTAPAAGRWTDVYAGTGATVELRRAEATGARMGVMMRPGGWAQANRRLAPGNAPVDLSRYSALRIKVRGNGRFLVRILQKDVWEWEAHRSLPFELKKTAWTAVTVPFATLKQHDWAWQRPFNSAAVNGINFLAESGIGPNELPCGLYNAEIHPLVPFALRGAIWYQGENNCWAASRYRVQLPALIKGWRRAWGQGDFPFYFVQLANFQAPSEVATDSDWAELREAQTMTLSVTNTGMAVAIDVGEANDIHPRDKQTVGRRLALNALAKVYGKGGEYSGPVFKRMEKARDGVKLYFSHAAGGLVAKGGTLKGFSVAGPDRKFRAATAVIDGNAVVVHSAEVPDIQSVRYAWAANPVCNLYNGEELPAGPFRTDDWELATDKFR
jgi:sialate O-acetylesterase